MKKEDEKVRKYYQLYYEYLKRSEDYKRFCRWMREEGKDLNKAVPKQYRKDKHGFVPKIVSVFMMFNDVHVFSFDEWWDYSEGFQGVADWRYENSMLHYTDTLLEHELDNCINSFRKFEGREPSLEEFKQYFLQTQKNKYGAEAYRDRLLLFIAPSSLKTEMLVKRFREIISKYKKGKRTKIAWDELGKYLLVYDLKKKGLKWKEIIKQIEPHKSIDDDSVRRHFLMYNKKAKQIIANVETGRFPGKY